MPRAAAFLDRDGVINEKAPEGQYVTRWEDFHLLPGAVEGITQLNHAGILVIVVTNQRCVAKGLLTQQDLQKLHQRMCAHLADAGARIDAIYCCPHELEESCGCRKPAPGMLLEAAHSYSLDLAASWMIGDSETDIQAGNNAGCKTIRLVQRTEMSSEGVTPLPDNADLVASSLLDAVQRILPVGKA